MESWALLNVKGKKDIWGLVGVLHRIGGFGIMVEISWDQ